MAQVVIVLSFTTIISLMLATFWVVVQVRDALEPSRLVRGSSRPRAASSSSRRR